MRYRCGAALVAGLVLASAFPTIGVAGLAWVAPGLILATAMGTSGRLAFRLGYVAGFTHHLISLSWLLHIPVFKLAPIAGWLALSGFLALYPAAWVWLSWRIFPRRLNGLGATSQSSVEGGPTETVPPWARVLDHFLEVNWTQRLRWALTCAALWVAWEMIQARFLSGFPWNLLGSSQFRMVPILQIASFTGVYGVSFLAVWFAVSLLLAAIVVLRCSHAPRRWMGEVITPLLVLTTVIAMGYRTALKADAATSSSGRTARLALVQPSIPQRWIWNRQDNSNRFDRLIQLTETTVAGQPDIVIWPEAAVPGFVRWEPQTLDAVTRLVRSNQFWLILGADDAATRAPFSDEYDVFNASFLVSPRGEFVSRYAKQRLVMFGEFIPFARWLPFLERWTGMGSFTPGDGPVPFIAPVSPEKTIKISVLICFEDVFPHGAREFVEADTDFLLNLTNNGWFGESAAQWQHAAAAVFRAVENGLPIVRCANNGLTCWVDAAGRMREVYFPGSEDIYGRGLKWVDVPLLAGGRRAPTFYTRRGDVFGWTCVALAGLAVWRSSRRQNTACSDGGGC